MGALLLFLIETSYPNRPVDGQLSFMARMNHSAYWICFSSPNLKSSRRQSQKAVA